MKPLFLLGHCSKNTQSDARQVHFHTIWQTAAAQKHCRHSVGFVSATKAAVRRKRARVHHKPVDLADGKNRECSEHSGRHGGRQRGLRRQVGVEAVVVVRASLDTATNKRHGN